MISEPPPYIFVTELYDFKMVVLFVVVLYLSYLLAI